jgi:hypothetical protein
VPGSVQFLRKRAQRIAGGAAFLHQRQHSLLVEMWR